VIEELFFIDDYQVRCNVWGNNNSPVIVCLHGLGNSSLSFIEIAENLQEEYKIISIDIPGHGKSEKFDTEQEYDMHNMATWILKVIKKMKVDKFYLLAHSYGADIALHFMGDYKSHVIKTLLIDGGYTTKGDFYSIVDELAKEPDWKWPNINDVQKEISYTTKYYNSFEYPSWESYFDEEAKSNNNWNHHKKVASSDYVREVNGKIKLIVDVNVAGSAIKSMANSPIKEVYKEVDSDILLLVATLPEEFTIINDKLLEGIKSNSKVTIKKIKDSTHMLHWDKTEVVIDEIRRLFK
jgi:pimeloyl-ACP methyl ester carboxylesterase